MECCKRLCCPLNWIKLDFNEQKYMNSTSRQTQQFLVKRKTLIRTVLVLNILSIISDIAETIQTYTSSDFSVLTGSSFNKLIAIDSIMLILKFITGILLLFFAQYHWEKYNWSTFFTCIAGIITFYFQMFIMIEPAYDIIDLDTNSIVEPAVKVIFSVKVIFYYFKMFLPCIMLINSILFAVDNLSQIFSDSGELKIVNKILVAIYIPVFTMLFFIVYQLITNFINFREDIINTYGSWLEWIPEFNNLYLILGVIAWILYTIKILTTLLSHPSKPYIELSVNLVLLSVIIILLYKFMKNSVIGIISFMIQTYFSYLSISIVTNDFVMFVLLKWKNENNLSADSFDKDIKGVNQTANNTIEFENLQTITSTFV